ncbi:hypothetical protein Pcinc_014363 [Petrolisthes cinctipes]|uniref:Uncharacterized protein n=1 Tax=Petrolisthes cinctipes TaxID=88211 RepID=A0AAE1FWL1_PETCI|nr:hypothetical protein Pcinc_014363 [Petrolisthes cinctipes]
MKLPAINVGSLTPLFTSSNQLLYHLAGWIVPGGDGFLCVNQVLDSRITNHCCIPAVYTGAWSLCQDKRWSLRQHTKFLEVEWFSIVSKGRGRCNPPPP